MSVQLITGQATDALRSLPENHVQVIVTSPPYFQLRDYGMDGQIGLERSPEEYVARMVEVFREARRVLRDDGILWLNIGDTYAANGTPGASNLAKLGERYSGGGHKRDAVAKPQKRLAAGYKTGDLIGIPWMLAFALRADGWYLRQEVIWEKPNPMPESVRNRSTRSHEQVFMLAKSRKYLYNSAAVAEDAVGKSRGAAASFKRENSKRAAVIPNQSVGTHRPDRPDAQYTGDKRNRRSVWKISTRPFAEAHFATMPLALAEICVRSGLPDNPDGYVVCDIFGGAHTTGLAAVGVGADYIGIDLNPDYNEIGRKRLLEHFPELDLTAPQESAASLNASAAD